MNIAPILYVKGRVRQVRERTVEAVPARPEQRDETGRLIAPAYPARDAYKVHDLAIDTEPGGLVKVVFREEAVREAEGYLPGEGDEVEVPVRAFDDWQGRGSNRYRLNGYSFAGAVYAAAAKSRTGGGARALASASSATA